MKFFSLLVLSVMASSAFAADQYNFKVVGFSKDNKKVAIVESVLQDGSGDGIATLSIIDVKANNLLKRVENRVESVNDVEASEEAAIKGAIAKANLKSFAIDTNIKGQTLLERLPTDFSNYTNSSFGQYVHSQGYSLALTETAVKSDACYDGEQAKILKLSLSSNVQPGLNLIMQEDKVLPKSRGCVLGYGISKVIKSGDALVVILNKTTPGFEGPDSSFLAVTAEVKLD